MKKKLKPFKSHMLLFVRDEDKQEENVWLGTERMDIKTARVRRKHYQEKIFLDTNIKVRILKVEIHPKGTVQKGKKGEKTDAS